MKKLLRIWLHSSPLRHLTHRQDRSWETRLWVVLDRCSHCWHMRGLGGTHITSRRLAGSMTLLLGPNSEMSLSENVPKVTWLISGWTGVELGGLASPRPSSFYSNTAALSKNQCRTTFKISCRIYSWEDMKVSSPSGHAFRSLSSVTDSYQPGEAGL